MPTLSSANLMELLDLVRAALPEGAEVYVVGGAVRDALLGRPVHDLDFALSGDVMGIARRTANALGAAFFPLHDTHETARLILPQPEGRRLSLDFAALRGPDLEVDLRGRDFTINAIALAIRDPNTLIDPLDGAADLRAGVIRACSPEAFEADAIRVLRAVRQALAFGFHIHPETRRLIRPAVPRLESVSPERRRDELFRIFDGPQPGTAVRALEMFGALPYLLPELGELKGVNQSPPHTRDVWEHTLDAVGRLKHVLDVLAWRHDPEKGANWVDGLISVRLGRYREQLSEHLQRALNPERSLRSLLLFAALYHDIAKPGTRSVEAGGRTRFFNHDVVGAEMAARRAQVLHLSNDEIDRVRLIVRHHMRPMLLGQGTAQGLQPGGVQNLDQDPEASVGVPSRRAIYRFFRAAGEAGVDVCLLSLADTLATYGPTLPKEIWVRHLDVVRALLEAWWERPDEAIAPPSLLNGSELMQVFGLKPGPRVGRLLEAIREAQATGQVNGREAALQFARGWLDGDSAADSAAPGVEGS